MSVKNYPNYKAVQEVRTKRKCQIPNFKGIRESEVYKDMLSMGFQEAFHESPEGVERPAGEEYRSHMERMGNISFFHPVTLMGRSSKATYPRYNIKRDGGVKVLVGPQKTGGEFPLANTKLRQECMTIEDYLFKMGFLIKYLLKVQKFPISDADLYSDESYKDLIIRKLDEDPSYAKNVELPQSVKKGTDVGAGVGLLKRFGGI